MGQGWEIIGPIIIMIMIMIMIIIIIILSTLPYFTLWTCRELGLESNRFLLVQQYSLRYLSTLVAVVT